MGLQKIFGVSNDSRLKRYYKDAHRVEELAPTFEAMSDAELKAKTVEYRERYAAGETLDELLPEVFAQVREASARVLGLRHYYEQILGGIVLHRGNIAEMKTGEGKTLVATLPAVLNAVSGKGVHIVTVNDYLARRDSEWMGKVYRFLGYTVGLVVKDLDPTQKQKQYACDIIYGTNNEFGFDYLRDNMVVYKQNLVQRELNYAIIDEVDSILVDEARTPLIISGSSGKSTDLYKQADRFILTLKAQIGTIDKYGIESDDYVPGDYVVDEKLKTCNLTEDGTAKAERYFSITNLADLENTEISHHINQALRAHTMMKLDRDYIVVDGEVVIVDEFTGRIMTGRRYSDGLHQAIEAKENVEVLEESKTLATVTFQNYFRMYKKLSGMTGTAKTEEGEFEAIYDLEVIQIPTHMPMIRQDANDIIYFTEKAKFEAIADEIARVHNTGQPILVGTVSVEKSEYLSKLITRRGIKHEVLNAKFHKKEAEIVAQAGKLNAVTIATNMAGRGTDILLGGNPDFMARITMRQEGVEEEVIDAATGYGDTDDEAVLSARERYAELHAHYKQKTDAEHDVVVKLGGLYILGTERHEARRIDNQLRGRSGRQGDPGTSRFYLALEDDLMRIFGGERIKMLMERLNPDDDTPLELSMLSKQIENAQKRIELQNFEIRKRVLNYDDVMNTQRGIIYGERRRVLSGDDMRDNIMGMLDAQVAQVTAACCPGGAPVSEWDVEDLRSFLQNFLACRIDTLFPEELLSKLDAKKAAELTLSLAHKVYEAKEKAIADAGKYDMRELERIILLRTVDEKWMDHIDAMDQLRQGIGLRAMGQTDPVVAYRKEGFDMFDEMTQSIQSETITRILHVPIESKVERRAVGKITGTGTGRPRENKQKSGPVRRAAKKIGPNDPCPCGSGKKYKFCCGANE